MIRDYSEAYSGKTIAVLEGTPNTHYIDVAAAHVSAETIVRHGHKDVIYLRILGQQEEASVRLTLDEAKDVAIALFDQIMFFEGGQLDV